MHEKKQQDKTIQAINMSFYELLNKAINTKVGDKNTKKKPEKPREIKS